MLSTGLISTLPGDPSRSSLPPVWLRLVVRREGYVAAVRASADGGADTGAPAVPLPVDWPGGGGSSGWWASERRVLREVAGRIRGLAVDSHVEPAGVTWDRPGVLGDIRDLGAEPGLWATGRLVQHLHAQLRLGVTEFHGALV